MPVDAQVDRSTNSATTSSPTAQHAEEESFLFPFLINGRSGRNGGNIKRTLRNLGGALFKRDARGSGRGWFNPEDFMQQKREWAKQFKSDQGKAVGWPSHAFENFLVVGLPPTTDVKSVVADVYTAQTAKAGGANMEVTPESTKETQHRGSRGQPLPPQILYSYPPEKPVSSEVAGFCFPHGVQPVLLERTPSMSALNEVIYSQSYQNSDGASFIFVLKVADNLPLYGVCCYMEEIVHRPPSILKEQFPDSNAPLSRYLVSAPRCYCFLTHYPFFSLHLKVLHMIMGLERLDRITAFVEDVAGLPPNDTLSTRLDSAGGQAVSSDSIRTATREALANDAGAQGLLNVHHEYDQEWGTMGQPNSGQPGRYAHTQPGGAANAGRVFRPCLGANAPHA
ncbi:hypothetical protein WJX72_010300 [[Myrmecia] bisecta]|uniref:uDENN domain-containing protein n=1 Tax=[Myrmecia] bisecta TaxID=41462 RepID=A0AAW1QG94_9CHLO